MKKIILILITVFCNFSWALLSFNPGIYTLEGLVRVGEKNKNVYLIVNENSNSQIEFLLKGKEAEKLLSKEYHRVLVEVKMAEAFNSSQGEVEAVSVKKIYELGHKPFVYKSIKEIPYKK